MNFQIVKIGPRGLLLALAIWIASSALHGGSLSFAGSYLIEHDERLFVVGAALIDAEEIRYAAVDIFAEMVGSTHTIYKESGVAMLRPNESYYVFVAGFAEYDLDGEKRALSAPAVAENDTVYIPFDDLCAILGIRYEYDEALCAYRLSRGEDGDGAIAYSALKGPILASVTKDELLNFARLLYFEARDGSILKKIAVGNVVLNRVQSDRFPNTINEVIFQRGQFPPAYYKSFATLIPTAKSVQAAIRALSGENVADRCLYFNIVPFKSKADDFYKNIEGDYFYY